MLGYRTSPKNRTLFLSFGDSVPALGVMCVRDIERKVVVAVKLPRRKCPREGLIITNF